MRNSILARIISGFTIVLISLFAVTWVSIRSIDALRTAGKDQVDSSILMKELGDITPAVLLAETGKRGFILTRDPSALGVYKQGVDSVSKEIQEVLALAYDQLTFQRRIVDLRQTIDEKLLNLQDSLAAFQEKGEISSQEVFTVKGIGLTEHIRSIINALINEIQRESEQREAVVNQRTTAAKRLFYFVGLLALIVGCVAVYIIARDLAVKACLQKKQEELIEQLSHALGEVKTLSGLLPICASCKKIRNDSGYWTQIEVYVTEHSEAHFTHGLCEECIAKLYPDLYVPDDVRDQSRNSRTSAKASPSSSQFPGNVE